ncbi:MAG: hypothetical protein IH804_09880 [Planctomycetes bacterium]|nr:hypothetical protein [Planctomycetota bacterium]
MKHRPRSARPRRLAAGSAGAWLGLLLLGGCEILGATRAALPMGGVALEMLVESGDSSVALYRVEPSGTIGFGGGFDARLNKTTWTGRMRPEEIDELLALLDTDGWFEADPASISAPPDHTYRITLSGPKGRRRFEVEVHAPDRDDDGLHAGRIAVADREHAFRPASFDTADHGAPTSSTRLTVSPSKASCNRGAGAPTKPWPPGSSTKLATTPSALTNQL